MSRNGSASALASFPRSREAGFTLTEIVLALAIIATAILALIGLLPLGMDASRQAANHTIVATILEDLHNRLEGDKLQSGEASFSPAFYSDAGTFISEDSEDKEVQPYYAAKVRVGDWAERPEHTSGVRPVVIELYWPVDSETGEPIGGSGPKTTITYGVSALSGPDWSAIDSSYTPKIEY